MSTVMLRPPRSLVNHLTCILLVLLALLRPATGGGSHDAPARDVRAAISVAGTVSERLPLALQGDPVRVVRPEKPVERQVDPLVAVLVAGGRATSPSLHAASGNGRLAAAERPRPVALVGVVELRI